MDPWTRQLKRSTVVAAVVVGLVVLVAGGSNAWASPLGFQITLGGLPLPGAAAYALASDSKGHTLSVEIRATTAANFAFVSVGQKFDAAVVRILDDSRAVVATYILSGAEITSAGISGAAAYGELMQHIVMSGRALVVTGP